MKFHFIPAKIDEICTFFPPNFNEILSEFHENMQKMTKCLYILRKAADKIREMAKKKQPETVTKFRQISFVHFIVQSYPGRSARRNG